MTLHYLVNLFKTPALDQPFVHFSVFLWRQPHVPFLHLRIHTSGGHQVPTQYFFLDLFLFICLCTCAPGSAWQFHCPKALFRQDEDSALLGPGAAKAPSDRRGTSPNVWFQWLFNCFLQYKYHELKIVHGILLRSYIMGFHVTHDSDTGVYIHLSLNTNYPLQRKPEEVRFGKTKSRFP